ncbi:DNA-directed RNA polymerase [Rhodocollybia butyracea]|uniref:DNA-directed RNA polymerases I and III subunit RPAC2 n=1 Tax=Rhodocollybia butyracea TaxID=206335 RepID=A0A9P5QCY3_9AGAR|nr:DNA-directed RNA polymerase [Rhodocollybia butyracea]
MSTTDQKIRILKGASADLSAATYQVCNESHTMGNALRWILMKNPKVEFCGYSVPHPSEPNIQIRIQMYDNLSSLQALLKALDDLENLCNAIGEAYSESLQNGDFERWDEKS